MIAEQFDYPKSSSSTPTDVARLDAVKATGLKAAMQGGQVKLIAAGGATLSDFAVAGYDSAGNLDQSFGGRRSSDHRLRAAEPRMHLHYARNLSFARTVPMRVPIDSWRRAPSNSARRRSLSSLLSCLALGTSGGTGRP